MDISISEIRCIYVRYTLGTPRHLTFSQINICKAVFDYNKNIHPEQKNNENTNNSVLFYL